MDKDFLGVAETYIENLGVDNFYCQESDFDIFSEAIDYKGNSTLSYEVASGASKIVLILEDSDYVIKLPILGEKKDCVICNLNSEERDEALENGINLGCEKALDYDLFGYEAGSYSYCWSCPYQEDKNKIVDYEGAENPQGESNNYCCSEEAIYLLAKEYGVQEFFLKTEKIGEHLGIQIYKQPKVTFSGFDYSKQVSNDSKELYSEYLKSNNKNPIFCSEIFATYIIEFYGIEKSSRLFNFISEMNINDLHSDNCGFLNETPVIFDYSGYRS